MHNKNTITGSVILKIGNLRKQGKLIINGYPMCVSKKVNPLTITFLGVLRLEGYGISLSFLNRSWVPVACLDELWAWDVIRVCKTWEKLISLTMLAII